jgi:hypothetical protein
MPLQCKEKKFGIKAAHLLRFTEFSGRKKEYFLKETAYGDDVNLLKIDPEFMQDQTTVIL